MMFPTFSLGDGSASVFLKDGYVLVTRENHRVTLPEAQAVLIWKQILREVPEVSTDGQKRDRQRLFAARLCGVDLQ